MPVHFLYSREAAVPSAHAHFTAALRVGDYGEKVSNCPCLTCDAHRELHDQHQAHANQEYSRLLELGIGVPLSDFGDWCISESGNIVFFEIQIISLKQISRFIESHRGSYSVSHDEISKLMRALSRWSKGYSCIVL